MFIGEATKRGVHLKPQPDLWIDTDGDEVPRSGEWSSKVLQISLVETSTIQ